jgi:glyoxylase-like metal-dependent hydrolase (beta-lactamase superfamily II)
MVPHLEQPRRELLGCSLPEPLPVHRVLRDGERIRWHEYEFVVRYTPGHCDYHMTLFLEHDGERIVVSGDVLFNFGRRDTAGEILPHWNLIYLNKTDAEAHYRSARTLADFSPSVVCPGHGRPFRVNPRVLENFLSETARIKEHLAPFVGSRSLTEAMSPHFCQALPFEQRVQIGSPFAVTVRLTNFRQEAMNGRVRLATPAGWRVSPAERPLHVHAGSSQDLAFELVILERGPKELHYFPYGIGLELNGRDWGEVGQGQVEIE